MRELFSSFYRKNLEVKSTKYGGSSITSSPGVFNFPELSTLGLQQFANYKAGFLPQHWFPQQILFFCLCSNKPGLAVVAFLIQKQWFAFWIHLFYESKKSYWFFNLFRLLLIFRMEYFPAPYMWDQTHCLFWFRIRSELEHWWIISAWCVYLFWENETLFNTVTFYIDWGIYTHQKIRK